MAEGWIQLHRKIQSCEIWDNNQPYDMRSAWIDLLLLANHRDVEILFDYEPITVKRGQYLTSVRKLCERWSWSKNRALKYLRLLENLKMIKRESNTKRTLITIVNYDIYQETRDTDEDANKDTGIDTYEDSGSTTGMDTGMPQTTMNNNDNNVNNYIPPLPPKGEQEYDFNKHSNVINYKYIKTTAINEYVNYIVNHTELDECVTSWMQYKDERKPKSSNHYGQTGLCQFLKTVHDKSVEFGIQTVIAVIEDSMGSNYQGIVWDKIKKGGTNGNAERGTSRNVESDEDLQRRFEQVQRQLAEDDGIDEWA